MTKSNEVQPSTSTSVVALSQVTYEINSYSSTEVVLEADICWVLKMTLSHFSVDTCSDFSQMFPDCNIAKIFACCATKAAYLISFGLAHYFLAELIKDIRRSNCYAISFDECLDKVTQTEQMDLIVRYWRKLL